jgi:hypothetical protein
VSLDWQHGVWLSGPSPETHSLPERYRLLHVKLKTGDGRFKIAEKIKEPGFDGYPLFEWNEHVSTHRLLREAKAAAEERAAA